MQFECDIDRRNSECRYIAMYANADNIQTSHLLVFLLLVSAEILFIFALFAVANVALTVLWNSHKFHPNMMRLMVLFIAHANVHCISRIVIILFQTGLIEFQDSDSILHKLLLLASEHRLYSLYIFVNLFIAFMLQRLVASIFISDYEIKQRHYIGRILVFVTIVLSHLKAIDSTYGIVFPSLLWEKPRLWSTFIPAILSELISRMIYARNLALLRYIDTSPADRYTLSIKYQLVENVRAAKLLSKCGSFSASVLIFTCILLLKRNQCLPNSSEESLWGAAFDMFNALTVMIAILFLVCSQKSWRFAFCAKFRMDRFFCRNRNASTVWYIRDVEVNTNTYFDHLGRNWQETFEGKYRRKCS